MFHISLCITVGASPIEPVADAPGDNVLTVTPPPNGCELTETLPFVSNDNILFALVAFTGKNVDTATVS